MAQCPPNIDFDNGTFSGWTLYTGEVAFSGTDNIITLNQTSGPVVGRHQMLSASPGDGMDEYGNFPKNCPNGSAHSIKLGNDQTGNEAEGASYQFTIPPNANEFGLVYYTAIVIQDPGHQTYQQPRLEVEILNVTDNEIIHCSSFDFIVTGEAPGFALSTHPGTNAPVWYKPWSSNSVNLNGLSGKTIRVFFKTADCTYISHFGYAYIDIATECSSSFIGNIFCPQDTALNIKAPFGYQGYTWYNENFTQVLGTGQTFHLSPPPPSGTHISVRLAPYGGYGCVDTLTTTLLDTLSVVANAGPDKTACNNSIIQIGTAPINGLVYKWSPATGLSNPNIANPMVTVSGITNYVLTVKTNGGGCVTTDDVLVTSEIVDSTIQVTGPLSYCIGMGQPPQFKVYNADSVQWYRNNIAIVGATLNTYTATESGSYNAKLFTNSGCILTTQSKQVNIYPSPVADFSVDKNVQCFLGNRFTFTDHSTISSGSLTYNWEFGNGKTADTKDVIFTYDAAGDFTVKLTVKAAGECVSRKTMNITVLPNAFADFSSQPVCTNLQVLLSNTTVYTGSSAVNYLWDFGNGHISNQANPVYSYPITGNYIISLTVNTAECTQPTEKEYNMVVDTPNIPIRYPDQSAIFNYPLQLEARDIGTRVLWTPVTNLNNPNSFRPVFKGITEQLYKIKIATPSGCITVDTQLVKTIKKIEIHVPVGFTPNGDGNNDYLKPLLFGFSKVNYFRVYNRWGKLFFSMESDQPGWDGKFNNIPQDMQTVVWVIEAVDVDGKVHHAKGTTILIR